MANLKERLAEQRKKIASNSGGYKFFRITEGTTRMRAVRVGKEKDFAIEATAFFLGKDLGYVVSPVTFGGKCAIMNAHNELSASKKESDRKFAKKFKPSKRYFQAYFKYKDQKGAEPDVDSGVKLLMMTGGQYQDLIDLFLDEDEAGDFTSPKKGYDIKFGRTGKGQMDTEYTVRACKPTKNTSFTEVYDPEAMLKELTPPYKETKELIEKFLNLPAEGDDDDDDDKPKKKKKKKSRDL